MNERVKRLKASLQVQKYPIVSRNQDHPGYLCPDKVFANVLARLPIFIEPGISTTGA